MRRIEKKLLCLLMKSPRTFVELVRATGWSEVGLQAAVSHLQLTGDICFDGDRYSVCEKGGPVSKLVLSEGSLVEEHGEGLLADAVVVEDKPLPEWLKNPPQPEPRWLKERKTRMRDRQ